MIVRHHMAKQIGTRVAVSLFALIVLSSMLFWALELLPGDFADAILGRGRTPERLAEIREAFGLNRPAYVRYFEWISNAFVLDFGYSWIRSGSVWELIGPRLFNSLVLAGLTVIVAVPLGLGLGIWAAARKGSSFDRAASLGSLVLFSVPDFVLAYFLAFLFVVTFRIFPAHTAWVQEISWPDRLYGLALPVLVLTLVSLAPVMRLTRASIVNVLGNPYIEMAHLKGMSPWRIITHHALPNAIAPIFNVIVMVTAHLIVGVVIIETLFSYRGMGSYMIESVMLRDLPVVQACGMIFAVIYISLFLLADIISVLSNPRLRQPNREARN